MELTGARVLVTGGRGFIGSVLIDRLLEAGADVVATSLGPAGKQRNVTWVQADVRSVDTVRSVIRSASPDVVFHLAALVGGDRSMDRVLPMLEADLLGAVHCLMAATEAGLHRVVFAGSLLQEPSGELMEPVPPSPYGAAKWAAAAYARMFHALYGTPVVVLRPSLVYGPGQLDLTKLVPHVATCLLRGETPRLTSGAWQVDWLYVDDLARAMVAAATAPAVEGATIDLGSGEQASVREVALMIADIVGGARPTFGDLPDRQLDPLKAVDVAGARGALGWSARVSLAAGLGLTVAWYREWIAAGAPTP